jgi:hypothetical protein
MVQRFGKHYSVDRRQKRRFCRLRLPNVQATLSSAGGDIFCQPSATEFILHGARLH